MLVSFRLLPRLACVVLALCVAAPASAQVTVRIGADTAVRAGDTRLRIGGPLDVQGAFDPQHAEITFTGEGGASGLTLTKGLAVEFRSRDDFDALAVNGTVTLGGTLTVTVADGARLNTEDAFDVLTCSGGCNGTFEALALPDNYIVTYGPNAVTVTAAPAVGTETDGALPEVFALTSPQPNPAFHAATLQLALPRTGTVHVDVFDVAGRRMAVLAQGMLAAGTHPLTWDVSGVPSGVYLVRAQTTGAPVRTQRVLVVR